MDKEGSETTSDLTKNVITQNYRVLPKESMCCLSHGYLKKNPLHFV